DVDCSGMANGCRSSRLVVLRSMVGNARSSLLTTTFPTVESTVCRSAPGVECTSTTSVDFPSFKSRLIVVLLPTTTVTGETTACANPAAVAVTEYVPGVTCKKAYSPSSSVVVTRTDP